MINNDQLNKMLLLVLDAFKSRTFFQSDILKHAYFIGGTLCLDVLIDNKNTGEINMNVITINSNPEVQTYQFFSGEANKRLLSLKNIKVINEIRTLAGKPIYDLF